MPRRCNTARRHGNDDDTGVITVARQPPLGKEPAPVATPVALSRSPPILRNKAKNRAPTTIRNGRHLPALCLGIGTQRPPCGSPLSPPHHLFPNDRKDGWDRRCHLARP
ncbi:hypothetical protein WOLCODRAFT_153763 [Wolfiporia cocos MD-104 SS10]|uniref:Uncharacterized protein n=1 Tax=Wolfiporia cocos (strain MD-104) TaxID=742152 RepID=A0A2H3K3T5_WOLCO|nr:hypothetical protein WOLCODRAFT_153763 [Wolfiporia cocos MD-104 SS10]